MHPTKVNAEPQTAAIHTSLDRCLIDGDRAAVSRGRRLRREALGISLVIETAALALLIISPLLAGVGQPKFSKPAFVPYVFSSAHKQPSVPRASPTNHFRPSYHTGGLIYTLAPRPPITPSVAEIDEVSPSEEIIPGSIGMEVPQIGSPQTARPPEPPREESQRAVVKGPLKLSESVVQAQLISRIEPRYPPLALETRTQGTVRLRAIISRDGRITALEVISGHPLLVQAALEAVRQWRYRPTLLNGEPVEVETSITVNFQLE